MFPEPGLQTNGVGTGSRFSPRYKFPHTYRIPFCSCFSISVLSCNLKQQWTSSWFPVLSSGQERTSKSKTRKHSLNSMQAQVDLLCGLGGNPKGKKRSRSLTLWIRLKAWLTRRDWKRNVRVRMGVLFPLLLFYLHHQVRWWMPGRTTARANDCDMLELPKAWEPLDISLPKISCFV